MRRRPRGDGPALPLLAAASLVLAAMVLFVAPAAAGATARPATGPAAITGAAGPGQEPDAPADDGTGEDAPGGHIIPEPDSGQAPTEAGDRGGGLQVLVFVLIVVGVGGIAALIVRDARRSQARNRAARPLP